MAERVGQQLGNYQLIKLLGEGGFAEVYLGEHIHLGTQAAIKVLHTQLTSEDVEKFRIEARTIARLIHPNIIRVLEFGIEGKTPFLVMDYALNGTLRQRHTRGERLLLSDIVLYVKQIADALQYAHEEKLIHRDVKPENMLVGKRGEVLLGDFGIALVAQSSRYQSMQDMAGTMAYMAPEQIQGKPRPASDQYALGIVVYEWLSGIHPFRGSFTELVAQHLAVSPPPLREKLTAIPPEVERVVMIALEKDPHNRFASIQAFAIALEQASQGVASSTLQSIKPTGPEKTPLVITRTTPLSLPQSSNNSQSVGTLVGTYRGHTDTINMLAWSPDGTRIATASNDGTVQVWNFPLTNGSAYTYKKHMQAVWQIAWSPDSTCIASISGDRRVNVWNIQTGRTLFQQGAGVAAAWSPLNNHLALTSSGTVQIWNAFAGYRISAYQGHTQGAYAVAWSPIDLRIASTGKTGTTVLVWDSSTGTTIITYARHTGFVGALAWSPDGNHIASASHDKTIHIWNPSTGALLCTYRGHTSKVQALAWSPNGKHIASASIDGTVQIWDTTTSQHVFTIRHNAPAATVTWSPDGKHIAVGCENNIVRIFVAP